MTCFIIAYNLKVATLLEFNCVQVVDVSFYDVALDFILLDSFDDIVNPPAAITAVMQNRWLTASMKQSVSMCVLCVAGGWGCKLKCNVAGNSYSSVVHIKGQAELVDGKIRYTYFQSLCMHVCICVYT